MNKAKRTFLSFYFSQLVFLLYSVYFLFSLFGMMFLWKIDPCMSIMMHGQEYIYHYGIEYYKNTFQLLLFFVLCVALPSLYNIALKILMLRNSRKVYKQNKASVELDKLDGNSSATHFLTKKILLINKIIVLVVAFLTIIFHIVCVSNIYIFITLIVFSMILIIPTIIGILRFKHNLCKMDKFTGFDVLSQ